MFLTHFIKISVKKKEKKKSFFPLICQKKKRDSCNNVFVMTIFMFIKISLLLLKTSGCFFMRVYLKYL